MREIKIPEMDLWNLHAEPKSITGYEGKYNISGRPAYNALKNGVLTPAERREAEQLISTDAKYSYWYAFHVCKGRFELGEEIISKRARFSVYCAIDILKGRFEKGEMTIMQSSIKDYYLKHCAKLSKNIPVWK